MSLTEVTVTTSRRNIKGPSTVPCGAPDKRQNKFGNGVRNNHTFTVVQIIFEEIK